MNEEKKDKPVMTIVETEGDSDPVIDELVVIGLQNQVTELRKQNAELEERGMHLEYQLSGMGDIARMNSASHLLASIVGANIIVSCVMEDEPIARAKELAEMLIGDYQTLIEKNAAEYHRLVQEQEAERKDDTDTVQ